MSGQVHDRGSIIAFWPDPDGPASGTALVVVSRESWTIRTELRRVVLVSGRYVVDDGEDR